MRPTKQEEQYRIIDAGNIDGVAHLIPEVPESWKVENTGWLVNSHIDLETWNTVYWLTEEEHERVVQLELGGSLRRRGKLSKKFGWLFRDT